MPKSSQVDITYNQWLTAFEEAFSGSTLATVIAEIVQVAVRDALAARAIRQAQINTVTSEEALTISDLRRLYGVGRMAVMAMIESGELRAVQRRMRGGRMGWVIDRLTADRVFLGRNEVSRP